MVKGLRNPIKGKLSAKESCQLTERYLWKKIPWIFAILRKADKKNPIEVISCFKTLQKRLF